MKRTDDDLRPITSIPVKDRKSSSKSFQRLISFNAFFFFSIVCLHSTQLIVIPLLFTSKSLSIWFHRINNLAKSTFAIVLVLSTQFFGQTKIVITSDEGVDMNRWITRDSNQRLVSFKLPRRSVIMANHQIYADWLYIWCLAYLAEAHGSIIITLKASLKWVPLVGPAMQMLDFIFLNRSWSSDKSSLTQKLTQMANRVADQDPSQGQNSDQLALLIFPEGTLVSPLTRPISKKYADKMGYSDLKHCLLPRSTGSLFCIRALHRKIPDLQLIDLTIGYPGIPSDGYGQDYYTLQSIFGHGHSPPRVHIHLRIFPVSSLPIGKSHLQPATNSSSSSSSSKAALNLSTGQRTSEIVDPTDEEVKEFDRWLRDQWELKDKMLENFYSTGEMCETGEVDSGKEKEGVLRRVEYQVGLRTSWEGIRSLGLAVPGIIVMWIGFKIICNITSPIIRSIF